MLSHVAACFRPRWMFPILRSASRIPGLRSLTHLFDPNEIRRKTSLRMGGRIAKVKLQGCDLLLDFDDHIGYRSYILGEPMEQSVYLLAKQLNIGPSDAILDIGANIGMASVPICTEVGCELIAVEASKTNAAMLAQNLAMNNVKAHLHILALTNRRLGFIPLHIRPGNRGANTLRPEWSPSKGSQDIEWVPTTTLDELMEGENIEQIKLVKIDVEGAELGVLQGAREFLRRNTAPILMEYRVDAMRENLNEGMEDLLKLMGEYYEVAVFENGETFTFDPDASYDNILFTRMSRNSC